jgi:hypothetical protein
MNRLVSYLVAAALTVSTGACIVRESRPVAYRSCGPGYHWDDGHCEHNGHGWGRGHDHDDDDDHGHDHDRDHRR